MIETIIKLLERFVAAHELLAANSAMRNVVVADTTPEQEEAMQGLSDQRQELDEPAPKKTRKPRQAKQEPEPEDDKGPDLSKLKEEIKTIAKHIAAGDDDDCANDFDDLLEDFKVRTVTKLADDDIEEFHKAAKKLVAKYYEITED